jgi:hypothetical protein
MADNVVLRKALPCHGRRRRVNDDMKDELEDLVSGQYRFPKIASENRPTRALFIRELRIECTASTDCPMRDPRRHTINQVSQPEVTAQARMISADWLQSSTSRIDSLSEHDDSFLQCACDDMEQKSAVQPPQTRMGRGG